MFFLQRLQRRIAVIGDMYFGVELLQAVDDDFLVHGRIVHHEDIEITPLLLVGFILLRFQGGALAGVADPVQ